MERGEEEEGDMNCWTVLGNRCAETEKIARGLED